MFNIIKQGGIIMGLEKIKTIIYDLFFEEVEYDDYEDEIIYKEDDEIEE